MVAEAKEKADGAICQSERRMGFHSGQGSNIGCEVEGALDTAKELVVRCETEGSRKSCWSVAKVQGALDTARDWWSNVKEKAKEKIGDIAAKVQGALDTARDWWSGVKQKSCRESRRYRSKS